MQLNHCGRSPTSICNLLDCRWFRYSSPTVTSAASDSFMSFPSCWNSILNAEDEHRSDWSDSVLMGCILCSEMKLSLVSNYLFPGTVVGLSFCYTHMIISYLQGVRKWVLIKYQRKFGHIRKSCIMIHNPLRNPLSQLELFFSKSSFLNAHFDTPNMSKGAFKGFSEVCLVRRAGSWTLLQNVLPWVNLKSHGISLWLDMLRTRQ